MKILEANAGALTNFEVLDFLRSRGAGNDATRVMVPVLPSEFKVYDYLERTAACNQTREIIEEFLAKCKKFNLAKAEILNISNIRPSSLVEIDTIIEECDTRFGENEETINELIETITEVLPPPPSEMNTDEQVVEDTEAAEDAGTDPPTEMETDAQAAAPDGETLEATK